MGYERVQKEWIPVDVGASTELLDLTSAATYLTWVPAMTGKIYGWGGMHMETIAAAANNTTAPVISMEYDKAGSTAAVEKSAITANTLSDAVVVGEEIIDYVTPFTCEAGDAIVFKVKTAAVGATASGEVRPFVLVEWFPALTGE